MDPKVLEAAVAAYYSVWQTRTVTADNVEEVRNDAIEAAILKAKEMEATS